MIMVTVQDANLIHENFKSSRVMRWWLSQLVLVPSQVVNANPSDSQVYIRDATDTYSFDPS